MQPLQHDVCGKNFGFTLMLNFVFPIQRICYSPATERVFHILISNIIIANKWDMSPINLKMFILSEYLSVAGLCVYTFQQLWRMRRGPNCFVGKLGKPIPIYYFRVLRGCGTHLCNLTKNCIKMTLSNWMISIIIDIHTTIS